MGVFLVRNNAFIRGLFAELAKRAVGLPVPTKVITCWRTPPTANSPRHVQFTTCLPGCIDRLQLCIRTPRSTRTR